MLVPFRTFIILLVVGNSYGYYMSEKKGDDVEYDTVIQTRSFMIPDKQWSGYLTKDDIICEYILLGSRTTGTPKLIQVELKDKDFPTVSVTTDPLEARVYRQQNEGPVRLNVSLTCPHIVGGYIERYKREAVLTNLKPIEIYEESHY